MAEEKNWIQVILMPLVVALVGIIGTWGITKQQERNAQTISEAQLKSTQDLAAADREVKILGMFSEKIASTDDKVRMLALRMLGALEPDLAERLAVAVSSGEPNDSEVKKVADQVAQDAAARGGGLILQNQNAFKERLENILSDQLTVVAIVFGNSLKAAEVAERVIARASIYSPIRRVVFVPEFADEQLLISSKKLPPNARGEGVAFFGLNREHVKFYPLSKLTTTLSIERAFLHAQMGQE